MLKQKVAATCYPHPSGILGFICLSLPIDRHHIPASLPSTSFSPNPPPSLLYQYLTSNPSSHHFKASSYLFISTQHWAPVHEKKNRGYTLKNRVQADRVIMSWFDTWYQHCHTQVSVQNSGHMALHYAYRYVKQRVIQNANPPVAILFAEAFTVLYFQFLKFTSKL